MQPLLLVSFNHSFETGILGIRQHQGVLSLLPKKGKDIELLKNWRPITLLNLDYKLLTKCLTRRLNKVIEPIIHKDQTGFIHNRYIGENINKIFHIATHLTNIKNEDSYLMAIDFEKAFDLLEFSFINKVMKFLNFGPMWCKWINVIYNNTSSCVMNNGLASPFFHTSRGVRQGCPLSHYLFVLSVEMLAHYVRNNEDIKGVIIGDSQCKISLYADDTVLFVKGGVNSVQASLAAFNDFSYVSRLKINIEKTSILPFGEHDHDRQQIANMGLSWTTGPLNILGVELTNRFDDHLNLNYKPKINIIKEHMSAWSNRIMTPMGRVVIVKTFIISQLVYLLSNLPSPSTDFLNKLDKMIFNFIWNGKFDKIKHKYLRLDKDQGGLNVPHLGTQDKVLKISWLHKLLNRQDNDVLFVMANNMFFGKLKYILTCNLQYKDCYIFQNHTSDFWQDVIKSWCTYNYVIPKEMSVILAQSIWYNSHIKIAGEVIYNDIMYKSGIKYIHNIIKNVNGKKYFMTVNELKTKYQCDIKEFYYFILLDAIPREWRLMLHLEFSPVLCNHAYNISRMVIMKKLISCCIIACNLM